MGGLFALGSTNQTDTIHMCLQTNTVGNASKQAAGSRKGVKVGNKLSR